MPYAIFCPPPTQEAQAEHNPHTTSRSPTEWSRAICLIRRLEETLREFIHLEEQAPFTHEILLACDVLNPLAVVRVRGRPERHLVEPASQIRKRYRKTRLASAL